MATLLLTAVGTVIGGPLGGALGALVGRSVDATIIGGRKSEGPRLKELTVQTSSYGTPIPLHFGTVRSAGSVIWATDLVEHRHSSGGGKGQATVTSYSYSASFAVAVASRPITGIGRVWADGNLLRGAAGDLKAAGAMRVHTGYGDQDCDQLIAQAEGTSLCPAHRHCAYVVFEDLDLTDFGNRLPSLTFEIIADVGGISMADLVTAILPDAATTDLTTSFAGFTIDQGSAGDTLATLAEVVPLSCATVEAVLTVTAAENATATTVPLLPLPAASEDAQADAVKTVGWSRNRGPLPSVQLCGVRYYDTARDYQPGLQRGVGRCTSGDLRTIELPAAMSAQDARVLAEAASRRAARSADTITYRVTELDPAIGPGTIVHLPVADGAWRINRWEWQKDGILLELEASRAKSTPTFAAASIASDAGRVATVADLALVPTTLAAFELPWDGNGSSNTPALFAAASASSAGWRGAALFAEPAGTDGTLVSLGSTGRARAIVGRTLEALGAASPLVIDRINTLDVTLAATDLALTDASLNQLLQGANRALVGREIIQFAAATPLGSGLWRLSALLRGRGGTEWAIADHTIDEPFVLLDERLTPIDPSRMADPATTQLIAVGLGDSTTVQQSIIGAGITQQPLAPVHGTISRSADGSAKLSWIRRARGAWAWPDSVETPINEEFELYRVAYGDADAPVAAWQTSTPSLSLSSTAFAELLATSAPAQFHVRQLGRGLPSRPLRLAVSS